MVLTNDLSPSALLPNEEIKLFEMFSGYGGASFGLKKAKIPFKCVGCSEINPYAIKIYDQNHSNVKNYGDCSKINTEELPDFNLLTGGFPCVDVSIAGKRDLSKGRTNLYLEILRIAKEKKPKYLLLENVKGLLSMGKKADNKVSDKLIDKIVRDLKNIGYGVAWKVLNSKNHGIPQNRERVWFVCKYGGWDFMEFRWPQKEPLKILVKDILEPEVDEKYFLSNQQLKSLTTGIQKSKINPSVAATLQHPGHSGGNYKGMNIIKIGNIDTKGHNSMWGRVYAPVVSQTLNSQGGGLGAKTGLYCVPVLTPDRLKKRQNGRRFKEDGDEMFTLTGQDKHGIFNGSRIRRLTPTECFRLMGFTNDEIKISSISDSQLYKIAGNGWDTSVVSKIFMQMFKKSNIPRSP